MNRRTFLLGSSILSLSASGSTVSWAGPPQWTLKAGTAGPGSLAYVWMSAFSTVYDQLNEPVRYAVTAGVFDVEALRLLDVGAPGVDISFVSGSSLILGAQGKPPFSQPLKNIRALPPLGIAPVVLVAPASSGINTLAGLAGKRITAGPAGTGNDVFCRAFLKQVLPGASIQVVPLAYAAFAGALQDGKVDALFTIGLPPYPALVEASSLMPLNFIPITADDAKGWLKDNPQHHEMVLPAKSYPKQETAIPTIGHLSHLITSAKLDDQAAYHLTKQWLDPEVRAKLLAFAPSLQAGFDTFSSGQYFQDLAGIGVKIHKGVAKAFAEANIALPAELHDQ